MVDGPKEKPLSEGVLADDSEQGLDGVAALPVRLDRYSRAHHRALRMAEYARGIGEGKLAGELTRCGDWLLFRHHFTVDQVRLHAADFCRRHLLCPFCAIRRGAKYLKAYLDRLEVVTAERPQLRAYLVTLTVRDGPDLGERFRHLRKAMKAMAQARRDHLSSPAKNRLVEFAKAFGGVHSIEVKRGANSGQWHPHAHMVWLCEAAPDPVELSREWQGWTRDSFVVDVRPFYDQGNVASGFVEVFKYALKFSDLALPDNWEAFELLRGKRLIDAFGVLRGVTVPQELADAPLDDELPFWELLYQYTAGGYSFAGYRHPRPTEAA